MKQSIGIKPAIIPTPVLVIGTYDDAMRPDVMVAAWGGICSGNPLSVAFSVQPSRYTYQSLLTRKECTISIPTSRFIRQTDFFGTVSGRDTDKFGATGLTPIRAGSVNAPYVGEFPIILECRIRNTIEIGIHVQFIAEVVDVIVDSDLITGDGKIATSSLTFVSYDPLSRTYVASGEVLMPAFTITRPDQLQG